LPASTIDDCFDRLDLETVVKGDEMKKSL